MMMITATTAIIPPTTPPIIAPVPPPPSLVPLLCSVLLTLVLVATKLHNMNYDTVQISRFADIWLIDQSLEYNIYQ